MNFDKKRNAKQTELLRIANIFFDLLIDAMTGCCDPILVDNSTTTSMGARKAEK